MSDEMSKPLSLTIIAAVTRTNGLGVNGTLPWKLPKEMAHFRKATSATGSSSGSARNAVIMGRKTWDSIPPKFRPLKGRINVVISRRVGKEAEEKLGIQGAQDTYLASSLEDAVRMLQNEQAPPSRSFLIGGAQLYSQAMTSCPSNATLDYLLITRIHEPSFDDCDVFLPEYRSKLQVDQDSSEGAAGDGDDTSDWKRCKDTDLDAFIGDSIERGIIEEKGVKYQLQMWKSAR